MLCRNHEFIWRMLPLKRSRLLVIFALAAFFPAAFLSGVSATNRSYSQDGAHEKKHGFVVKQYEDFHDVLHPLEHEALPQNDFKRIRTKSALLANRGKAIVRLGVPRGISKDIARSLPKN